LANDPRHRMAMNEMCDRLNLEFGSARTHLAPGEYTGGRVRCFPMFAPRVFTGG
jgi:hypothetical protein